MGIRSDLNPTFIVRPPPGSWKHGLPRPPKGSPRGPWAQHIQEALAPDPGSSIPRGWPGPPSTPASTAAKMPTLPPTRTQQAPTHLLSANPKRPSLQSSPARSPESRHCQLCFLCSWPVPPPRFSPHSLAPFPQRGPECPLWAEPSSRKQSRLPCSPAEPETTRDMMSSGGTSLKDLGWGFDGSRPPSPRGWAQRDGGQPPQPRQGPPASPVPPSIRRRTAVVWKRFGKCFPDAETGLVSLPSGMSVCQQKERTTPHPPPRQPASLAPAFLSKLVSHRAPLPGPRLGRGPHAAPAKLQLPLVLGPSHPRPLNWGFRARTAMSLGSAGSRTRRISSPHLWYLSLGAMDTSSRKPSRRPLKVPGRPVACCQPAEREVILASGYRAGTGGAWLGLGALDA